MYSIGQYSVVGANCSIDDTAIIGHFCKIAKGTIIGKNVSIGDYVRTGEDSIIRDNTTIKAYTVISKDVAIGDNVFIGPRVSLLHEALDGKHQPCTIKANVYIGASSIVAAGVTIEKNIIVGACSFVNNNLIDPGTYIGISCIKKVKQINV